MLIRDAEIILLVRLGGHWWQVHWLPDGTAPVLPMTGPALAMMNLYSETYYEYRNHGMHVAMFYCAQMLLVRCRSICEGNGAAFASGTHPWDSFCSDHFRTPMTWRMGFWLAFVVFIKVIRRQNMIVQILRTVCTLIKWDQRLSMWYYRTMTVPLTSLQHDGSAAWTMY